MIYDWSKFVYNYIYGKNWLNGFLVGITKEREKTHTTTTQQQPIETTLADDHQP